MCTLRGLKVYKFEKRSGGLTRLPNRVSGDGFWIGQWVISKLPFASVSKQVFLQNYSYETEFAYEFIFMQIKLFITIKIWHKASCWIRDTRELGNG